MHKKSHAGLRKRSLLLATLIALAFAAGTGLLIVSMIAMPGKSYAGDLHALTKSQQVSRSRMIKDLTFFTKSVGDRNFTRPGTLKKCADYIEKQFNQVALGAPCTERQKFSWDGRQFENIIFEHKGDNSKDGIIVIGAHYDSVDHCPGADDNGTGTTGVIELARLMAQSSHHRTLRFVAFPNEEHYFRTHGMGSYHYAERCHNRGEKIKAMISLEMLGYYSDKKDSQKYPPLIDQFYPKTGNFIAFVGDTGNRDLITRMVKTFRDHADFPSEAISAPKEMPGIDWSDQLYFCEKGYPAMMVTDTAFYRNPNYHGPGDSIETIDFDKMTRVVTGLVPCIEDLANN